MANVPDPVLHARILAGDEQALGALDDQVGRRCVGWLIKHFGASYEDAEEAWSDALAAVWEDIRKIDPAKLSGYAFEVAKHKAASAARKQKRRIESDALSLDDYMTEQAAEQVQHSAASPLVQRLRECIEHASERVRTVARLLQAGADSEAIASVFEVKEDSAYQIKARALRALRECLERSPA